MSLGVVDANRQWDRETAIRMGRKMEQFNLIVEEPLDAYDVEGRPALLPRWIRLYHRGNADQFPGTRQFWAMPAISFSRMRRVGGISPFLKDYGSGGETRA